MTRLEALKELAKKVEAGDIPDTGVDRFNALPSKGSGVYADQNWYSAQRAYWAGSLDAAKALHEAVLPEFKYMDLLRRGSRYTARISKSADEAEGCDFTAVSSVLSRALLLSDIRALIAQEESA